MIPIDHFFDNKSYYFTIIILLFSLSGCIQPQIEPQHHQIIIRLCTAVSLGEPNLVLTIKKDLLQLFQNQKIDESQFQVFNAIIAKAESQKWEEARIDAYRLRDTQKVSSGNLDNYANRTLPEMKKTAIQKKR